MEQEAKSSGDVCQRSAAPSFTSPSIRGGGKQWGNSVLMTQHSVLYYFLNAALKKPSFSNFRVIVKSKTCCMDADLARGSRALSSLTNS